MTERAVSELLERAASCVPVGPAPLGEILESAAQQRRHRRLVRGTAAGAGVAAAAVLLAATVGGSVTEIPRPEPSVAAPSAVVAPAGMRFIGLRDVAVAAPRSWGTNELHCGTPTRDTVVVDTGGVVLACAWPRGRGIETVSIGEVQPGRGSVPDNQRMREISVAGVPAQRSDTTCAREGHASVTVCRATVVVPSRGVVVNADSSTGAGEVDRALARITIVPGQTGVPGYRDLDDDHQGGAAAAYTRTLRDHGFAVKVLTQRVGAGKPGYILNASPEPGRMLPKGSIVSVTVIAAPDGPADEVSVGINSLDRKGE